MHLRRRVSALLFVVLCGGLPAHAGSELKPWTGGAAPPLVLRDLDGRTVSLADYRGKVVLVNFWATWCAPCIEEMPAMQRLRDKFALAGFEVLAVNFQEGEGRIKDFLKKRPLDLTIVRDHDGSVRTAWGVRVFPTSFIIGPDQQIKYQVVGDVDWTSSKVETQIRSLLPRT